MNDQDRSKQELIEELAELRQREALAASEPRLLEVQEIARVGFYVHDVATGCWTSSSVLDRLFGISD